MPWFVARGHGCQGPNPWAVVKGTPDSPQDKVACHATEDSARAQVRALYAAEGGNNMTVRASYLSDITSMQFDENDGKFVSWVHALPLGEYKHPVYGTMSITVDRAKRFAENVKNKIRGIDPSINYVHNNNDAAAGWVKDADARADGVWLLVEWVKDAAQSIKDKKWRYFSSEFEDEWTDPTGNKHKDVLFGGALTNRPFMKNLVPINLSENTVDNAFELVSAITGSSVDNLRGGDNMALGEEDLDKIVTKLTEKIAGKATPPGGEGGGNSGGILDLSEAGELRQLAEENPLVQALINQLEANGTNLADMRRKLQEEQITARLAEFDRSKIVLTPVAKEIVYKLLTEMPVELHEQFWKLMTTMRNSNALLVELGERAGARVNYGEEKSAKQRFTEATNVLVGQGTSYADAVQKVAEQNPQLYDEYRREAFAFRTTS